MTGIASRIYSFFVQIEFKTATKLPAQTTGGITSNPSQTSQGIFKNSNW